MMLVFVSLCGCIDFNEGKAEDVAADSIVNKFGDNYYFSRSNVVNTDAYDDGDKYLVEVDVNINGHIMCFACYVEKGTWDASQGTILKY